MKKKLFISFIIVFVFLSLFIFFLQKKESVTEKEAQFLPLDPALQAKLDQHNLRMQTLKKQEEKYQKNKTDIQREAEKKFAKKLAAVSESMLGEINFYGQAVDQHGDAIVGARIRYDAGGATFAKGSGKGETISDENGLFIVTGKGQSLLVSLSQKNHEFLPEYRFASFVDPEHPVAWPDYITPDKPYIFKGWKVESYPKVKVSEEKGYSLTPDGRTSTFDLLTKGKPFKKGLQEGDFTISFDEVGENWVARIESLAGGLIETDDVYMNLAPEAGYQSAATYNFPIGRRNIEVKNYYLKMRDGYYGRVKVEYRAYPNRKGKATVYVSSVVNLEKGRNLTVKQQ
jgi:hypothetical protein